MKYETERRDIVKACLYMNRRGINQGTSGNISVRVNEGFLLTPSGMAYDEMKASDIVLMRPDGSHVGKRKPSSEWRFHHALMTSRAEISAVVHTHSMFATTLSCLGLESPAMHYMIAAAGGGNIRCAPYATYGTQETADNAVKALQDRNACLLANHGMIVVGRNLKKAMWLAVEVETLAAQYWRALQVGKPNILPKAEVRRVMDKFKTYGQVGEPVAACC
ncbi:class II aldolase/adducin family protein [Dongia deserti]|uniref:class II aldolase/adducin family protein n=1 Tax=Dongia deserti TaxID=2268030 RepID=UPI0025473702|nr:class II aldolase/adducin family protein [Dongia deserti]